MRLEERLIQAGVAERKPVVLASGQKSDVYIDVKKAYGDPSLLRELADGMIDLLGKDVTCVAGSDYGGLALSAVMSVRKNLKLTMVRKEPKGYGLRNQIEGYVPKEIDRVAVVDDVFTTGGSMLKIIKVLAGQTNVEGAYVVVKRTEDEFLYKLKWLFTLKDFRI